MSEILIAFFSRRHENYYNGKLVDLKKGNTRVVAEQLAQKTAGDLLEIEPVNPYNPVYSICIEEAKRDLNENRRPPIQNDTDCFDQYKVIFLGYPNYWGTMPMHVWTWLKSHDFKGKTVIPFCTHEGSGMGNSLKDLKSICNEAEILKGTAIKGSKAESCDREIEELLWQLSQAVGKSE